MPILKFLGNTLLLYIGVVLFFSAVILGLTLFYCLYSLSFSPLVDYLHQVIHTPLMVVWKVFVPTFAVTVVLQLILMGLREDAEMRKQMSKEEQLKEQQHPPKRNSSVL